MNTNKRLVEAKPTDPELVEFDQMAKNINHPFVKRWNANFEKHLKETAGDIAGGSLEPEIGVMRGQTVGDSVNATGYQVTATYEIFNACIRGFSRYMDDSFVKKYVTDSVVFKIPLVEYRELASNIDDGEFPHTEKSLGYATVDLSSPESEKGAKVSWTRSLIEDMSFDVQAEMMEGLGHAIAMKMNLDIVLTLLGIVGSVSSGGANPTNVTVSTPTTQGYQTALMPHGDVRTITSGAITWAQFLATVGDVDIGVTANITTSLSMLETAESFLIHKTYGPADFFICSPEIYWQLLNIIQLTNVLYEGSTDPIRDGRIKLALGVTIVKNGLLPSGFCIALNSEKAVALVVRRNLKLEPVLFPVWNEYGFIGSVRYGCVILFPQAIQVASASGLLPVAASEEP